MSARVASLVAVATLWTCAVAAEAPLAARLAAASAGGGWVGYAVPGVAGTRVCSGFCRDAPCKLQEDDHRNSFSDDAGRGGREARAAQPSEPLRIYVRLRGGAIESLRLFSQSCALDTQGQTIAWLDDVAPSESVAFFAERARRKERESAEAGLTALAHHADPDADKWLETFVAPGGSPELREHAAFWLGHVRGRRGYDVLRGLLADPDRRFREHVVFAISQSPLADAQEELFRLARQSADATVRGRALFWLGQRAGERATATLARAAEDDPDVEVKRQAVFGLSQLPKDEGVPQLIRIARTHREPEVRKAALFWLGQSGDSRALALFEEILVK